MNCPKCGERLGWGERVEDITQCTWWYYCLECGEYVHGRDVVYLDEPVYVNEHERRT